MALLTKKSITETILAPTMDGSVDYQHIFEPEFHQEKYQRAEAQARSSVHGWFQLTAEVLERPLNRGTQPEYADNPDDLEEISFIGKMHPSGQVLTSEHTSNIAALKSVSVRNGYVDFDSARSVTENFFERKKDRAGIKTGDLLINSTGDGTIGRVAVYNSGQNAMVDGHITIARFKEPDLAWYTAAYLMTASGQDQLYRYINGSSGQVELYPGDLARLVIPLLDEEAMKRIVRGLKSAAASFEAFRNGRGNTLQQFNKFSAYTKP